MRTRRGYHLSSYFLGKVDKHYSIIQLTSDASKLGYIIDAYTQNAKFQEREPDKRNPRYREAVDFCLNECTKHIVHYLATFDYQINSFIHFTNVHFTIYIYQLV